MKVNMYESKTYGTQLPRENEKAGTVSSSADFRSNITIDKLRTTGVPENKSLRELLVLW